MLLAWWFLALLIAVAAGLPVLAVVLGIRRRLRRRAGRPVIYGWRLAARRTSLALGTLIFGLAATAAGVNDHYSYIPSFHALFGDVSPDLCLCRMSIVDRIWNLSRRWPSCNNAPKRTTSRWKIFMDEFAARWCDTRD